MTRPVAAPLGDAPVPYDRRAAVRHACQLEVLPSALEPPEAITWGAVVENLSRTGVGLRLCYPFKPGTHLAVELRAGGVKRTFITRVVRASDLPDGAWLVGCEFTAPLDDDVRLV
jgi:hypothetical protein